MGKHTNKGVVVASGSGIVIGTGAKKRIHIGPRMRVVLTCAAVVVLVGGAAGAYAYHKYQDHKAVVAKQKELQSSVTNSIGDTQKLHTDTTSLIQGATNGTYKISNKDLAAAYAARGDAELNSGDNKSAVTDYGQAVKLEPSMTTTVGYGEFLARYRLGERKTLIPLLQQLDAPIKNSKDFQDQGQSATYESYITDLQQGEELPL